MQDVEGVAAGALVVLVVGDEAAAEVGGDDLGRLEVPAGEGGLAGAGGADEDDEGQVGDGQRAQRCRRSCGLSPSCRWSSASPVGVSVSVALGVNTAIWVGGPTSGSSGPDGHELARCSRAVRPPRPPSPGTPPGSTRSGGRRGGRARRAASPSGRCTRRSASSRATVRGRAEPNTAYSRAGSRGRSRCSTTSLSTAASYPLSRLSV